jgi:hypothetical protein
MTESEANEMATWFYDRFPGVGAATLRALKKELMTHDLVDAKQAADEYLTTGEKFIEVSRVVAIAFRIGRQRRDREKLKNQEHNKHLRYGHETRLQKLWAEADAWIADTSDEDLATLKADVLAGRPDLANVLKNRAPRMSITLRGLIYERATGKRVAV